MVLYELDVDTIGQRNEIDEHIKFRCQKMSKQGPKCRSHIRGDVQPRMLSLIAQNRFGAARDPKGLHASKRDSWSSLKSNNTCLLKFLPRFPVCTQPLLLDQFPNHALRCCEEVDGRQGLRLHHTRRWQRGCFRSQIMPGRHRLSRAGRCCDFRAGVG